MRLIVEDDGRGFSVDAQSSARKNEHWLGLAGMHERAALVGGRVTVESTRGRGTTLFARVPLDRSPGDLTE